MHSFYFLIICFGLLYTFDTIKANDDGFKRQQTHFNKDLRDDTDRDVDSLFEEWEVKFIFVFLFFFTLKIYDQDNDEEILPEDERHDYYIRGKNRPMFRPEDFVGKEPEHVMKMSKKGQTLMMFATVSGSPTRRETEEITQIWWASLKNALYDVTR